MCNTASSSAVFNFCNPVPRQLVNLQQCNPIFQPCPSGPFTYFTNPTTVTVNGSFTVVNTSANCTMNIVYVHGGTSTAFALAGGRSETIFFEDLTSITIECLMGTIPEANCSGNLLLDLHYCVRCVSA